MQIKNILDMDANEIAFEDGRTQVSIMYGEDTAGRRVNIVVVDGQIHVEQYIEHGEIHLHTTRIDLIGERVIAEPEIALCTDDQSEWKVVA